MNNFRTAINLNQWVFTSKVQNFWYWSKDLERIGDKAAKVEVKVQKTSVFWGNVLWLT